MASYTLLNIASLIITILTFNVSSEVEKYLVVEENNCYEINIYADLKRITECDLGSFKDKGWLSTPYSFIGHPIITKKNEGLLFNDNDKNITYVPKFQRLKNNLEPKGNILIQLQNSSKAVFHIYAENYPVDLNYRVDFNSFLVKKCSKEDDCGDENKLHCPENSEKPQDGNGNDENIFYISWKVDNGVFELLIQNKGKILKCIDQRPINFKQLVCQSQIRQEFNLKQYNFLSSTTPHSTIFNTNFDLGKDEYIYFQVGLCPECKISIYLFCKNYNFNKTIHGSSNTNWNELFLGNGTSDSNCDIKIITESNKSHNNWWILNENVHIVSISKIPLNEQCDSKCFRMTQNCCKNSKQIPDNKTAIGLGEDKWYAPYSQPLRTLKFAVIHQEDDKEGDSSYVIISLTDEPVDNGGEPYQLEFSLKECHKNDNGRFVIRKRKTIGKKPSPYVEPFFDLTKGKSYELTVTSEVHRKQQYVFTL